jgi:hypothetical protein
MKVTRLADTIQVCLLQNRVSENNSTLFQKLKTCFTVAITTTLRKTTKLGTFQYERQGYRQQFSTREGSVGGLKLQKGINVMS